MLTPLPHQSKHWPTVAFETEVAESFGVDPSPVPD